MRATILVCFAVSVQHSSWAQAVTSVPVLVGLTGDNHLVQFSSDNPSVPITAAPISVTGLQTGDVLTGLDANAANDGLIALADSGRTYLLNPNTGAATLLGGPITLPILGGARPNIDVDPVSGTIRMLGGSVLNQVLSPVTGLVSEVDALLGYGIGDPNLLHVPNLVAGAYDPSSLSTVPTSTTLYAIDAAQNALVRVGDLGLPLSISLGSLHTVGPLGVNASTLTGFDIAPDGTAFITLNLAGHTGTTLGLVNLLTGVVTLLNDIGGNLPIVDLAVLPQTLVVVPTATPVPTATVSPTATAVPSPTATVTPVPTATVSPTATAVPSPTSTATPTATATVAPTTVPTVNPTATSVPTASPVATATPITTGTPVPTGDDDHDSIANSLDLCPGTTTGSVVNANGCAISQLVPCQGPLSGGVWRSHHQYVINFMVQARRFLRAKLISRVEMRDLRRAARASSCGR